MPNSWGFDIELLSVFDAWTLTGNCHGNRAPASAV